MKVICISNYNFQKLTMPVKVCVVKKYSICSPVGNLEIESCRDGLHSLNFIRPHRSHHVTVDPRVSVQLTEHTETFVPHAVTMAISWLEKYFDRPQSTEGINIPPICKTVKPSTGSFRGAVWAAIIRNVPPGVTISYLNVANLAGYPGAARAVGSVMRHNPIWLIYPCHRVVKNDGTYGNYGGGRRLKSWLIKHEKP